MLLLHVTEGSDDGQQFLSVRKFLIFDYFWLHWVLVAVHGFSLAAVSGGLLSRCGVQASDCSGFSRCRAQAPELMGFSTCGSRALELGLRSCGKRVELWYMESSQTRDGPSNGRWTLDQ